MKPKLLRQSLNTQRQSQTICSHEIVKRQASQDTFVKTNGLLKRKIFVNDRKIRKFGQNHQDLTFWWRGPAAWSSMEYLFTLHIFDVRFESRDGLALSNRAQFRRHKDNIYSTCDWGMWDWGGLTVCGSMLLMLPIRSPPEVQFSTPKYPPLQIGAVKISLLKWKHQVNCHVEVIYEVWQREVLNFLIATLNTAASATKPLLCHHLH